MNAASTLQRAGLQAARQRIGPVVRHEVLSDVRGGDPRLVLSIEAAGHKLVAKIDTSRDRFDRESAALEVARSEGIPVPKIVHADAGPPGVLLLE